MNSIMMSDDASEESEFLSASKVACVAGARKGKGKGKIGRTRNTFPPPSPTPLTASRARALDFFSPFPLLAPATQATSNASLESFVHKALKDEQIECIRTIVCHMHRRDGLAVLPTGIRQKRYPRALYMS